MEIKKSKKPIKYDDAIRVMEKRLHNINLGIADELVWILEHEEIYTAGKNHRDSEIIDKSIKIVKTNRGGKITYHGPGQLVCYFVIDLKKRKKDIRKFVTLIEKTIMNTLEFYKIKTFADRNNIGIWYNDKSGIKKVAAIGLRVSKWIAYHGFSININNDLTKYNAIVPCGVRDKGVTNLKKIKKQNYKGIEEKLIKTFTTNLKS